MDNTRKGLRFSERRLPEKNLDVSIASCGDTLSVITFLSSEEKRNVISKRRNYLEKTLMFLAKSSTKSPRPVVVILRHAQ
jgi:hypothetical protein